MTPVVARPIERTLRAVNAVALMIAAAFAAYLVTGGLWLVGGTVGLAIGTALLGMAIALCIQKGGTFRSAAIVIGVFAVPLLALFWSVSLGGLLPN